VIPELGHFALILALLVAIAQGALPLAGAAYGEPRLMALSKLAARPVNPNWSKAENPCVTEPSGPRQLARCVVL
jgi:cytochrome c biogenesis factor